MSDEAAFLAVLKANPADDTARLVYADWLDEHDEPQKAEYLRLVVALARRGDDLAGSPELGRVFEITTGLDPAWCLTTSTRFALTLTGFTDKVWAIKATRELTGMGLGESKAFVERAPVRFPFRLTPEAACVVQCHFPGAQVKVDSLCHANDPVVPVVFDASVHLQPRAWDSAYFPPESIRAFREFLVACGHLTPAKAARMRRADPQSLASELEPHQLEARLSEWRSLLPPDDASQAWHIIFRVVFHPARQQ